MRAKKVISLMVTFMLLGSTTIFAEDSLVDSNAMIINETISSDIGDYVENFVEDAYEPYYSINQINSMISDITIEGNTATAKVEISLVKTLKANTVNDLP